MKKKRWLIISHKYDERSDRHPEPVATTRLRFAATEEAAERLFTAWVSRLENSGSVYHTSTLGVNYAK